jgi:hypothetical protein
MDIDAPKSRADLTRTIFNYPEPRAAPQAHRARRMRRVIPWPTNDLPSPADGARRLAEDVPRPGADLPCPGGTVSCPGHDVSSPGNGVPCLGNNVPWLGNDVSHPGHNIPESENPARMPANTCNTSNLRQKRPFLPYSAPRTGNPPKSAPARPSRNG